MKNNPLKHLRIKTGDEWRKIFTENFNQEAYEEAVEPVKTAIADSKCADELYQNLKKLEYAKKCEGPDMEFEDDCTIIWCNVELDRSQMTTEADYVGVRLYIEWNEQEKKGAIKMAFLYSTVFSKEYVADELCRFDPETFDIMEWLY